METRYELQSAVWKKDGTLEVWYRKKSFFAGSSQLTKETMSEQEFVKLFSKKSLPTKSP